MPVSKASATPSVRSSTLPPPNPTMPCGVCVSVYTTAGYAHLADRHIVEAAEKIEKMIEAEMMVK